MVEAAGDMGMGGSDVALFQSFYLFFFGIALSVNWFFAFYTQGTMR